MWSRLCRQSKQAEAQDNQSIDPNLSKLEGVFQPKERKSRCDHDAPLIAE
jgi:hypothetical protein